MASCGTLVGGTVWIKCRQSGKCPVCGCGKLCKEYSRPPSKFYALVDSALDCESKLLLARQGGEYISLVLPHHLYFKPNAKWFWLRSLGWSGTGSVIQDLSGSWCIKGIGEYTLVMDSPVLLMHHNETDLGSPILIQITPKERTLWSLEISVIICTLNLQWESHAGPHLTIGGCACWLWYTCQLSCIMHYCQALCMTITQKSWSYLECHNVCQSL